MTDASPDSMLGGQRGIPKMRMVSPLRAHRWAALALAPVALAATTAPLSAISSREAFELTVQEFKQISRGDRFDAIDLNIVAVHSYYLANDMPARARCIDRLSSPAMGDSSELVRRIHDQIDIALHSVRVFDIAVAVVELNCPD